MGIDKIGPRVKILNEITRLKPPSIIPDTNNSGLLDPSLTQEWPISLDTLLDPARLSPLSYLENDGGLNFLTSERHLFQEEKVGNCRELWISVFSNVLISISIQIRGGSRSVWRSLLIF